MFEILFIITLRTNFAKYYFRLVVFLSNLTWISVKIGSGKILVLSGIKSLPKPILTKIDGPLHIMKTF